MRFFFVLMSVLLVMAVSPTHPVLAQIKSSVCKTLYSQYQSKTRYRSFAVSNNGLACAWAEGYSGQQAADDEARRVCRNEGRGSCYILSNTAKDSAAREKLEQKKKIQSALNLLGFNVGKVDGKFGPATSRGISAFQRSVGQAATGRLSPSQQQLLFQKVQQTKNSKAAETRAEKALKPRIFSSLPGSRGYLGTVVNPGRTLVAATNSSDNSTAIWSSRSGVKIATLDGQASAMAFTADGTRFFYAAKGGHIRVLNTLTGLHSAGILNAHDGKPVFSLAVTPSGDTLVTASDDGKLRVWDTRSLARLAELQASDRMISKLSFFPNGREMLVLDSKGTVQLWDMGNRVKLADLPKAGQVKHIAISESGNAFAYAPNKGMVTVFNRTAQGFVEGQRLYSSSTRSLDFLEAGGILLRQRIDGVNFSDLTNLNTPKYPPAAVSTKGSVAYFSDPYGAFILNDKYGGLALWAINETEQKLLSQRANAATNADRARAKTVMAALTAVQDAFNASVAAADAAFENGDCKDFGAMLTDHRGGRTEADCRAQVVRKALELKLADAENRADCDAIAKLSEDLGTSPSKAQACFDKLALDADKARFAQAMTQLDCKTVAELEAGLNRDGSADKCRFTKVMTQSSERELFFAAVRYDSQGEDAKAQTLYSELMDRFPDSQEASQAAMRLLAMSDRQRAAEKQAQIDTEMEALRRQAAEAQRAANDAKAEAARARANAQAAQTKQRQAPRNRACDHVYAGYYFRTTQRKVTNTKEFLGTVLGATVMGNHFHVQGVNRARGVATACSSDSGKCFEFKCSEIP